MTDARIAEAYVEAVTKATTVSARLAETYLEAVIGGQSPRRVVEAYLEVLTSSTADPTGTTGVLSATLPPLSAQITGTVAGTTSGAIAATLPKLGASITGTLPTPITGTIGATMPSLKASIGDVSVSVDSMDAGFSFGSTLVGDFTTAVERMDAGFSFGASLFVPRNHILDPRTRNPQYQLRVVDDYGVPIADVAPRATMDELSEALNDPTEFGFTLATMDAHAPLVTPTEGKRPPTVQLWRGQYLAGWVDVVNAVPSSDGSTTTYRCKDRRWTLEHEHIGKSPLRNLIGNGDFSQGDRYGQYGWDAGSTPAANPLHAVVSDDFSSSGYALQLTGADKSQLTVDNVETGAVFVPNEATYLSGGEAIIQEVGTHIPDDSDVHIVGHTADNGTGPGYALSEARAEAAKATLLAQNPTLHITTEGVGYTQPVATNSTEAGQAKNRRVVISYQGVEDGTNSAQWRMVAAKITHPTSKRRPLTVTAAGEFKITEWRGPNLNNWAVRFTIAKASSPGTIIKTETVSMDGAAGMESYEGSEVSLDVPADGVEYLLRAYYYAPAGTIRWIDIGLYPDDVLGFYGVDQALIVKALIEHAQDPAMGRASLNLATNCRLTGVPRNRPYLFRDRMPIATAVEEFPALYRGMDIDLVTTPTKRTVTTFYPRQGESTTEVLALGHNVVRYEAPVDLTQCATSVVVQADSISAHRQEGHTADASRLGGMVLERIVKAEKETPYRDLQGAAVAELARFGGPFPLLMVECHPRYTSDLIDTVRKGDIVRAIVRDGRTNIDGLFSVYERRLDPNTDALTYRLSQED